MLLDNMFIQGVICLRILVFSDSHGQYKPMKKAIEAQSEAEAIIFLGDGHRDFEYCKQYIDNKRIYSVKGNNDFHCEYPLRQIITENNENIYVTHGHYEYVKSSLSGLLIKARENNCKIALYGHTHNQQSDYYDGIYTFCPGALYNDEYGVIDITDKGIICIGMKVK